MTESKASKDPKASKAPKGGPQDLRIPSPLSHELDQLVYDVIGAAMRVHSTLGPGLLENVYEDALVIELNQRGIVCKRQVPIQISYEGQPLRDYRLDLVVANQIIVEIKTVTALHPVHSSQMLTYLRVTQHPVGIILNFHERHLRNGIRRHVLGTVKTET